MSGMQTINRQALLQARRALLTRIYAPALKLEKTSPEYRALEQSGKVWEDWFQPSSSSLMGYVGLQRYNRDLLAKIDEVKAKMPPQVTTSNLVAEFAQQSVMIENNPLKLHDAVRIHDAFKKEHLTEQHPTLTSEVVHELQLPDIEGEETWATAELRNAIFASQWISQIAATKPGTAGISETETQALAALTVKGTGPPVNTSLVKFSNSSPRGGYRRWPVQVRSDHLVVFPYPVEVPACVERFFQWRNAQHAAKELHPLVLACQMTAYFVHIHPFYDGNGRVSRMLGQDYLARQGYFPPVLGGNLERMDYIRMISAAHKGRPKELVEAVLEAQLRACERFAEEA
ncbi:Adenosine monophosphate-protein transferase Fic [Colletotrichum spinosum]|uniref:Adenosine monophosphate-protein transferase Fic n=1 Tax=Colletotrichum spinosum TaxID=1347390 RepID=A0A4R8Q2P4_9PEZI|nr:Adenosine monophosphate-protein transferase Fic [Colletotrichum spinosum]